MYAHPFFLSCQMGVNTHENPSLIIPIFHDADMDLLLVAVKDAVG